VEFAANAYIFKTRRLRGLAHWLIMWGCVLAAAITFPLVWGWIHFETVPGDLHTYRTFVFGIPTQEFPVESFIAFVIFHGLVWSSFLVIAGVMLAFRRRMIDHGAVAVQQFGQDILPPAAAVRDQRHGLDVDRRATRGCAATRTTFSPFSTQATVIVTLLVAAVRQAVSRRSSVRPSSEWGSTGMPELAPSRPCVALWSAVRPVHMVRDLDHRRKELGFSVLSCRQGGHYQDCLVRMSAGAVRIGTGRLWDQYSTLAAFAGRRRRGK
jgi:hypothetical protein